MLELIQRITNRKETASKIDQPFQVGDTVEVHVLVREGEKERTQLFKGVVLKIQGAGASKSFTVRKISDGVGVERTFPFASPRVEKVRLVAHGTVRRGRLFYLRGLAGKAARINSEMAFAVETTPQAKASVPPAASAPQTPTK